MPGKLIQICGKNYVGQVLPISLWVSHWETVLYLVMIAQHRPVFDASSLLCLTALVSLTLLPLVFYSSFLLFLLYEKCMLLGYQYYVL